MERIINSDFVKNESLFDNKKPPNKESCTIPITGLLPCWETMQFGTNNKFINSAFASID